MALAINKDNFEALVAGDQPVVCLLYTSDAADERVDKQVGACPKDALKAKIEKLL